MCQNKDDCNNKYAFTLGVSDGLKSFILLKLMRFKFWLLSSKKFIYEILLLANKMLIDIYLFYRI